MNIGPVRPPIDISGSVNITQTTPLTKSVAAVSTGNEITVKTEAEKDMAVKTPDDPNNDKLTKNPSNLQELTQMTEAMNKFIQAMDAGIRFTIHEQANQLMVQVVDQKNDKVLKEFPSREFLDTIAAIRDYVGILLDEKI